MKHLRVHAIAGVVISVILTGCQAKPITYVAPTPREIGDSYACSFRLVNERGYTVTSTDRGAAFISAEKHRDGAMQTLLGREDVDRLTIAIYGDTTSQQHTMRVSVSATRLSQTQTGSRMASINPSDAVTADAQAVLANCAE